MAGFFYNLGKKVGPKVRKGQWIWHSLTGTKSEAIAAEYSVGNDLAKEVLAQLPQETEPRIRQLLSDISERLTKCVVNKERKFSFYAINQPGPNAFALPGGFIFITCDLIELCNYDPGELAFVLGHEMGHVIKGHAIGRIISSTAISTVSRNAAMRTPVGGWLKKVGIKFLESAYSQGNEFEADRLGAGFIKAADYDKDSAQRLLTRLGEINKDQEQGNDVLGTYFSTHPPIHERIIEVKKVIGHTKS